MKKIFLQTTECFHIDSYISGARIRICDAIEKSKIQFYNRKLVTSFNF